jgi:hypothetical protein
MKIRLLLLLAVSAILVSSCKKDDPIPDREATLQYDGPNATAPQLEAGYHELAVYFPSSIMSQYKDWKLSEITWFGSGVDPNISSDSCAVKIYDVGTTSNTPGALLYEADVSGSLIADQAAQWREHLLPTPLTVSGEGIWISLAIRQDTERQFIGCDAGPNKANADWLYKESDGNWQSYIQRTSESVNWNIRAKVEE